MVLAGERLVHTWNTCLALGGWLAGLPGWDGGIPYSQLATNLISSRNNALLQVQRWSLLLTSQISKAAVARVTSLCGVSALGLTRNSPFCHYVHSVRMPITPALGNQ